MSDSLAKNEKLTLRLSVIAIFISIVTPIVVWQFGGAGI